MEFKREKSCDLWAEIFPLLFEHWAEVGQSDLVLSPDREAYDNIEEAGGLRCFTARQDGELKGYAIFFVRENLHYKNSVCAVQDVIWLDPGLRAKGGLFIRWCDKQLALDGVDTVYHTVSARLDWGPLLEALGYQKRSTMYRRRIDGDHSASRRSGRLNRRSGLPEPAAEEGGWPRERRGPGVLQPAISAIAKPDRDGEEGD